MSPAPARHTHVTGDTTAPAHETKSPSASQRDWLSHGLTQPGGKLPLFTGEGLRISARTIRCCIENGWAEPWLENPVKPEWQICRLTAKGRTALKA